MIQPARARGRASISSSSTIAASGRDLLQILTQALNFLNRKRVLRLVLFVRYFVFGGWTWRLSALSFTTVRVRGRARRRNRNVDDRREVKADHGAIDPLIGACGENPRDLQLLL